MRKFFLFVVFMVMSVAMMAQRSYTFNATALNVDGLPNEIFGIEINPDGKEAAGATALCGILANSGWDVVGFSEDFNFHDYLTAAPAGNYYNFGEHGGGVSGLSNSTDGLGFACAKRLTMSGGTRVGWSDYNGFTDQGADGLINKGFRVYTVTFAAGVAVDVYVLHMDADDGEKDIAVRKKQLTQLAAYIKNNHNGRPIIILGDTNCRYTRDELKTAFVDVINADARFVIKDAWIEHMWGGSYPAFGSDAMMTHTWGDQKGEVVDKMFYINTTESNLTLVSNSYLHDTSVGVSDHYPVVVNFTLTDPNGAPLTDAEKENNWTLEEGAAGGQKPKWEGEQVVSGTAYYLMNVGTGEYIRYGGAYYTEAVGGNAAMQIIPVSADGGRTWVLNTSTLRGWKLGDQDYTYTDQSGTWYLEPVDGTAYQYRIRSSRNLYLSANTSEKHHPIKSEIGNADDDNQKWLFLTDDRIRAEMAKATSEYPFNFTALLKSADFDVIEYEDGWTASWTGFNQQSGPFMGAGTGWGSDAAKYVSYAYANTTSEVTMSQDLGTLPNGTYNISFEGFYRSRYKPSGLFKQEQDEARNAVVSFGSADIAIPQNISTTIGASADVVDPLFRDGDTYAKSQQIVLGTSASVTLSVNKPATSSTAKGAWICIDNFRLIYYGTGAAPIDPYKEFKDRVCTKVNETYSKVALLNSAGQSAYDISEVVSRYMNDMIKSQGDADALCAIVDRAYANAYAAHLAAVVKDVVDNMDANGGDVTGAIINHSFETGDLFGWEVGVGQDVKVYPKSNVIYATDGCHGEFLFNSWNGDDAHTSPIKQTVRGLKNGLYELRTMVTSFGGCHVYLIGNGYHESVVAEGKEVFKEGTLYFLVEDGCATIGVVGGNKGAGNEYKWYWPWEGCFFKADNFRLRYVCDVAHGRLKLALMKADSARLDVYGQTALDIAAYRDAYENRALTSDGKPEAEAVRVALQKAAKAQKTAGADMTWAITNPSFEAGDYKGWACETGGDTKVALQENGVYAVVGAEGRYVFNTWSDQGAQPLTQTVSGLTNGTYRLTAMVATDQGQYITLSANGQDYTISAGASKSIGVFPEVVCLVTDGELTISVAGESGVWFKADDFRLALVSPENLILDETDDVVPEINGVVYPKVTVKRTIKPETWSTFVVPFDIPKSMLSGWEVKELSESKQDGDHLNVWFKDCEDGIKAGVPYMVRNAVMEDDLTEIVMENVKVNTLVLNNKKTDGVTFVGQYVKTNIPVGDFFISGNTFYQAAHDRNTMKGFRARLVPDVAAGVKSVGIAMDGSESTSVDNIESAKAVVESVYGADGIPRPCIQIGLNIVKMSDGTVKKVYMRQ